MRSMTKQHHDVANLAGVVLAFATLAGCPMPADYDATEAIDFPRKTHSLLPPAPPAFSEEAKGWHLGSGMVTGTGPEQPIAFPHYTHVTQNGMECEYCHQAARKSIHAGVPQVSTCMNCHTYVGKDKPEVAKVAEYFAKGESIPWKKVHDLPDFVHFSHKRHVRAGVDCTECHGQMGLQGKDLVGWGVDKGDKAAHGDEHGDEHGASHDDTSHEPGPVTVIRETTMQMGWCLDCHATHPSIDTNYGNKADLRRAELKDCWTCHK